jgi:hypothetical protein
MPRNRGDYFRRKRRLDAEARAAELRKLREEITWLKRNLRTVTQISLGALGLSADLEEHRAAGGGIEALVERVIRDPPPIGNEEYGIGAELVRALQHGQGNAELNVKRAPERLGKGAGASPAGAAADPRLLTGVSAGFDLDKHPLSRVAVSAEEIVGRRDPTAPDGPLGRPNIKAVVVQASHDRATKRVGTPDDSQPSLVSPDVAIRRYEQQFSVNSAAARSRRAAARTLVNSMGGVKALAQKAREAELWRTVGGKPTTRKRDARVAGVAKEPAAKRLCYRTLAGHGRELIVA